jgi:hypothetical protein
LIISLYFIDIDAIIDYYHWWHWLLLIHYAMIDAIIDFRYWYWHY